MHLDDLTEERSIASIQNKTNLAKDVIENIFAKKFSALNRTQALGAISIIEREFKLNLDPLKEECRQYFNLHSKDEGSIVIPIPSVEEGSILPKIIITLIIIALGYGGWYFFVEYYQKKIDPMSIETTIQSKPETNNTTTQTTSQTDTKPKVTLEEEAKKLDITIEEPKAPSTLLLNGETTDVNETKKVEVNTTNEVNRSSVENVVDVAIVPERTVITLQPQGKMWFRVTDIKTKMSYEFRQSQPYDINMTQTDWLIGIQNSKFDFIDKGELKEYGGRGKLFYRLDQSGITPIDQEEYRLLYK